MHSERRVGVINPPDNPYLHIVPVNSPGQESPQYRYKDSLAGMNVVFLKEFPKEDSKTANHHAARIAAIPIPLTPSLNEIPPLPINLRSHVEEVVNNHIETIVNQITPDAVGIMIDHGSIWGLEPERILAEKLQDYGIAVKEGYPRVGGRKRIQKHAVVFDKIIPEVATQQLPKPNLKSKVADSLSTFKQRVWKSPTFPSPHTPETNL